MSTLSLVCLAAVLVLGEPPIAVQLILLGTGIAALGVPHGALDHLIGRGLLLEHLGRWWIPAFFVSYLALAAGVVTLWWKLPGAALLGFLAISIVHFGLGDVRRDLSTRSLLPFEVVARGALPIVVPVLSHPEAVGVVFSALGSPVSAESLARYATFAALTLSPALGAALFHHAFRACTDRSLADRGSAHLEVLAEVLILLLVFWLAPPLIAFLVYFCGWHSARHTLETAEQLIPGSLARAVQRFALLAAPLSVATLVIAVGAWGLLRISGQAADPAFLQVTFIGLAALTVPHMMLCAAAQQKAFSI